jgi:hypothetical protein
MQTFWKGAVAATALALSPLAATAADAAVFIFETDEIFSYGELGDEQNEVYTIDVGANASVIGIGWDVTLFADSPSWLGEMVVAFGSTASYELFLTPAIGDDFPGTATYSSDGVVDLVGIGLDFTVGADGLLQLEFFEDFDDFPEDWDGIWESGALTIVTADTGVVPEPATWAMMIAGFGLVGLAARRRRLQPATAR